MNIPENAPITMVQMIDIAVKAGEIMKLYFSDFGMEREIKHDSTPLTIADTQINTMVIDEVRKISHHIDIVGEEVSDRVDSPWQVCCDPIDGTFPYTWGMPVSTFMFGVSYNQIPVMGMIYDPFTNRLYHAEHGKGAWLNKSTALKISGQKERPVVGYCSWPGCPYNVLQACQYLESKGISLVNFCSIGYLEAAVATGELAGTIFPGTSHHDTVPGHIIVEQAGGKVTDIFGNNHTYDNGKINGHIMSNGHIHDLLVEAMVRAN